MPCIWARDCGPDPRTANHSGPLPSSDRQVQIGPPGAGALSTSELVGVGVGGRVRMGPCQVPPDPPLIVDRAPGKETCAAAGCCCCWLRTRPTMEPYHRQRQRLGTRSVALRQRKHVPFSPKLIPWDRNEPLFTTLLGLAVKKPILTPSHHSRHNHMCPPPQNNSFPMHLDWRACIPSLKISAWCVPAGGRKPSMILSRDGHRRHAAAGVATCQSTSEGQNLTGVSAAPENSRGDSHGFSSSPHDF